MDVSRPSHRPTMTEEDWDGEARSRAEEAWSGWLRKGVGGGGGGDEDEMMSLVGSRQGGMGGVEIRVGWGYLLGGIVESFGLLRNAIATFSSAMTTTTICTKTFNSPSPGIYQLDFFFKAQTKQKHEVMYP